MAGELRLNAGPRSRRNEDLCGGNRKRARKSMIDSRIQDDPGRQR
jgi:hypothetical protein